jgi:hypothetical protein
MAGYSQDGKGIFASAIVGSATYLIDWPSIESANIGCTRTTGDKVRAGGDREQAIFTGLELERHHSQNDRKIDQ